MLAVVVVTMASATQIPQMSVYPINEDEIIVSVMNNKESYFEISVTSENGDLVYYKRSEKPISSYQKLFEVKNLENGDYKMKIKVDKMSLERELLVTAKKIYVKDPALQIDPHFEFDGKDLKFSYLNFKKEKFKMKIYDENELVFQEKLGNEFPINSGYDLSKLDDGNYRVVFSSFNNEFVYNVEK